MAYVPVCDRVAGTYEDDRTGTHHILACQLTLFHSGWGVREQIKPTT